MTRTSRLLAGVILTALSTTGLGAAAPVASASVVPAPGRSVFGADISWPNCANGQPMPLPQTRYVVLGLTRGPAFTPNPCLRAQVDWVRARHLWVAAYAITNSPTRAQFAAYGGRGTRLQRMHRVGRAQAAFNLRTARAAGLRVPVVWVDVEPYPKRPWSTNTRDNNAVIDGAVAGYRAAGLRVGIYSYASGWRTITGGRSLPGAATWVPAGRQDRRAALAKCSAPSFSGGPVYLGQWTDGRRDYNVTCPRIDGLPARLSPLTAYARLHVGAGARGPAVAALQRRLAMASTGYFGPVTRANVRAYQRRRGLPVNGVVTPVVWRAMGAGSVLPARPHRIPSLFAST